VYGARKTWLELRRRGVEAGRDQVARVMRAHGSGGRLRGRKRRTTIPDEAALERARDLLQRDFSATGPNEKWICELTYLRTCTSAPGTASHLLLRYEYPGSSPKPTRSAVRTEDENLERFALVATHVRPSPRRRPHGRLASGQRVGERRWPERAVVGVGQQHRQLNLVWGRRHRCSVGGAVRHHRRPLGHGLRKRCSRWPTPSTSPPDLTTKARPLRTHRRNRITPLSGRHGHAGPCRRFAPSAYQTSDGSLAPPLSETGAAAGPKR
jgi:hypothetical protein